MAVVDSPYSTRKMFTSNKIKCLHRPHAQVAATASIPSKYRTIVISKEEKKGFNSGTKRFEWQDANDSPGPAKYIISNRLASEDTSFSKKGLGGFASKVKRFPSKLNPDRVVGPGAYNPGVKVDHDFNRAECTGIFHKPICKIIEKGSNTPAPNSYNFVGNVIGKTKQEQSVVVHPPFLSGAKREYKTPILSNPAPNAYDLCNGENERAVQAPFKSTSKRIPLLLNTSNPGPGYYSPFAKVNGSNRIVKPRKHYLCLASPAIQMPPAEPPPGPGQYDIVDYDGPRKEHFSSSMFRSATNRWRPTEIPNSNPGPATYNPKNIPQTSFIHNGDKKWL